MAFKIVRATEYEIQYRTTDRVSRVKNELAGSFSCSADAQDVFDSGRCCEKWPSPVSGDISGPVACPGKRLEVIRTENLSPQETPLLPEYSR